MTTALTLPALPESVAAATLLNCNKNPADTVLYAENLADPETHKLLRELPAPARGALH